MLTKVFKPVLLVGRSHGADGLLTQLRELLSLALSQRLLTRSLIPSILLP